MSIFSAIFERDLFTVRRYTAGARDALNRPTRTLTSSTVCDGMLRQTGSVEGEAFVVDEFVATLPLGTDIRASDEVVARGDLFTVQGRPASTSVPGIRSIGVVTARLKYVGPVTP